MKQTQNIYLGGLHIQIRYFPTEKLYVPSDDMFYITHLKTKYDCENHIESIIKMGDFYDKLISIINTNDPFTTLLLCAFITSCIYDCHFYRGKVTGDFELFYDQLKYIKIGNINPINLLDIDKNLDIETMSQDTFFNFINMVSVEIFNQNPFNLAECLEEILSPDNKCNKASVLEAIERRVNEFFDLSVMVYNPFGLVKINKNYYDHKFLVRVEDDTLV